MPAKVDPTRVQPVTVVDPTTGYAIDDGPVLALRIESNSSTNLPVFIGRADPGSDPSQPVWRIRNFLYDAGNNVAFVGYPNGDASYAYIWDQRGTYSYA